MSQKLISICIPTYSRPQELKRTLESIDSQKYNDVNIVISENCSPKQVETRAVVEEFKKNSKYDVYYYENEQNLGYDKNIRALVKRSEGIYSMFFSDDDMFMPGALDKFIEFVRQHQDCGYFLRSYRNYSDVAETKFQDFRYYASDCTFPAGNDTAIELFDKSVFLSGFTIKTEPAREYVTDELDGSLLYQLYLLLEVCRRYPSAYSRILISKAVPYEGAVHYFGNCKEEKDSYETGAMVGKNQLNFLRWYTKVMDFVGNKYSDDTGKRIRYNMSKYSYINLVQELKANPTKQEFKDYCRQLEEMGFNSSRYYYFYKFVLGLFGYRLCNKCVAFIKKNLGYRPKL